MLTGPGITPLSGSPACREIRKAWSQNPGHENLQTTLSSYEPVATYR